MSAPSDPRAGVGHASALRLAVSIVAAAVGCKQSPVMVEAGGRDASFVDASSADASLADRPAIEADASGGPMGGGRDGSRPPIGGTVDEFRAFPGAEGYGALALTGCDRTKMRLVFVTSLAGEGPGTLREAIESPPASPDEYRVVVFRTGGTITLTRQIRIDHGCLYVAGQSAPGDGIQLRSPPEEGARLLLISEHSGVTDVVLRYLRLRSGRGEPAGAGDNITIASGSRHVLDHLSMEWANDEALGLTTLGGGKSLTDVSVQRSIIAEVLERHSTGTLFGEGTPDVEGAGMSMHHNLFAHNRHRNPRVTYGKRIEVIHNVTYNWASRVGRTYSHAELDLIGNSWIPGPLSRANAWFQHEGAPAGRPNEVFPLPSVYWSDNRSDRGEIGWDTYVDANRNGIPVPESARRDKPHAVRATVPVPVTAATEAFENVLSDVGTNARLDCDGQWIDVLDRVDEQIILDVRGRTGRGTRAEGDHPDDYGGYPNLDPGIACDDADGDGMFDTWETRLGLDPTDSRDASQDRDGDGYSNLEELLNGTHPGV